MGPSWGRQALLRPCRCETVLPPPEMPGENYKLLFLCSSPTGIIDRGQAGGSELANEL